MTSPANEFINDRFLPEISQIWTGELAGAGDFADDEFDGRYEVRNQWSVDSVQLAVCRKRLLVEGLDGEGPGVAFLCAGGLGEGVNGRVVTFG